MKLVFYSPQFLPSVGGLQNVVHYWADELTNSGHQIIVACTTPGSSEGFSYHIERNASFGKLVRLMRHADLVIMFNVSLKALPQWCLSGTPLVISHHTAFRYEHLPISWQQKIKRRVANNLAIGNIACSNFIARDYDNCVVVPNAYDEAIFFDRQQPRIPHSILFVGRLVSDKGIDLLIDVLGRIKKAGDNRFTLNIVGTGPLEEDLKKAVRNYGLENAVNFSGALSSKQIAFLMNQYEILAIPSRLEPFGLVVLEGLACGCQVICSNQGGLPEAGGEFVTYCDPGSVDSLMDAIREVTKSPKQQNEKSKQSHLARFKRIGSANTLELTLQTALEHL